jgi:carbamoyltransferase
MLRAEELDRTGNLVYMGGVALNCKANDLIGAYFRNIWIMPNPGDCGSSLGAAALSYGGRLNWKNAYLGTDIAGPYPVKELLSELVTNKIVGVASGRAEFGPRALGNRSLIADPRVQMIQDKVNLVKRREKFRPFAPSILEEYFKDVFETSVDYSRYMNFVFKNKYPEDFEGITHIDGTARVQTVDKDSNTIFRQILLEWRRETGMPLLLNTSLNIKGQPLVNDEQDAKDFFIKYNIRVF